MADVSVVFNAIGRETGVTSTLGRIRSAFRATGTEGTAAMRQASAEVGRLDREIDEAQNSLRALAREFANAGTAAERIQLSRQMARQRTEIKRLMNARDLLPSPDEFASASGGLVSRFVATFRGGMSTVGAMMGPVMAGAAAASLPVLGGAVAAAVLGGAGVGGVIGGVVLASRDARVAAAGKALGASLLGQMENSAAVFIRPVLQAVDTIRARFHALDGSISSIFAKASRFVGPLVDGAMEAIGSIIRGIDRALDGAQPVIWALREGMIMIGQSVQGVFDRLADDGVSAGVAIRHVFQTVAVAIDMVGRAVNVLVESYSLLAKAGLFGADARNAVVAYEIAAAEAAATNSGQLAPSFQRIADTTANATAKVMSHQEALDDLRDRNLSAFEATTRAAEAIREQTQAITSNGRGLDANTQKGQRNRSALVSLARALNTSHDAIVKQYGAGQRATRVAEQNRAAFIRAATAATGSARAAERLANELLGVKSRTVTVTARTGAAQRDVSAIKAQLRGIDRYIPITIAMRITGNGNPSAVAAALRKQNMREMGGPVKAGEAYIVGEKRAEVFVPDRDGEILPRVSDYAGRSGSAGVTAAQRGASRFAAAGGTIRLELAGEREIVALVRRLIRNYNLLQPGGKVAT